MSKLRLTIVLAVLVSSMLGWADSGLGAPNAYEDPDYWAPYWYRLALDKNGQFVLGDGHGYAGGNWFYYPETGWWRQWFYNGPYDPNRKAELKYHVYIMPIKPLTSVTIEVRMNWTTPGWSALDLDRPPLPGDVIDPALEPTYMDHRTIYEGERMWNFESIEPVVDHIVKGYNPEWISIDFRGYGFYVFRGAIHECVADQPEPGTGACCNETTGDCSITNEQDCPGPYRWLGEGSSCSQCPGPSPDFDFGDAPDPTYPTLSASNGARHIIVAGVHLGDRIDAEPDGQPNATATGDDGSGQADEDGVTFTSGLVVGDSATVDIEASVAGVLNAWVDFDGDGSFADPDEQIFTDEPIAAGVNDLAFHVPVTATVGNTYTRFRFSTVGGVSHSGVAVNGEVEDYAVLIEQQPALWSLVRSGKFCLANPVTGARMIVLAYTNGTLEFRDWRGEVLASRGGFDEITVLDVHRGSGSPLPHLYVGSTDHGGTLRVIDPADIHRDLATRRDFGRITALWPWADHLYVGSTDSGGTLRKVSSQTLGDQKKRSGFGQITAIGEVWNASVVNLLVASTDSGGTLQVVSPDTLANVGQQRSGLGAVLGLATGDVNGDGTAEVVIGSTDRGGTVRYVEADNLSRDIASRDGFGTIYAVAYGFLGIEQAAGNGKASIAVASSDNGGAVRIMEVDADRLSTSLAESASRVGLGHIAAMDIMIDAYSTGVDVLGVLSSTATSAAVYILDDALEELAAFNVDDPNGGGPVPDSEAPTPNPLTWSVEPHATSGTTISMTATAASDPCGVEYSFECTAGGGHDSGWQASATYTDTNLLPSTEYAYRARARDKSPRNNQTNWSSQASATTGDDTGLYVQATFDNSPNGFTYVDDAFRNTRQPAYASGNWLATGGRSGGALQVSLGGLNLRTVRDMSGGWRLSFVLASTRVVTLSLWYNLTQTPHYDGDEWSEVLLGVDGNLVGRQGPDYVARIMGNGNGGPVETTGWQRLELNLGALQAGQHTITIGGYNNKKSWTNESTEILIDDVLIQSQ